MKKRILLVDDETVLLEILKLFLTDAGYEVQCAEDGLAGLRAFQEAPSDLVVMDRAMPLINGENLAHAIKGLFPNVPLIMITGLPDAIRQPEFFECILKKPFPPSELLAQITRVMAKGLRKIKAAA